MGRAFFVDRFQTKASRFRSAVAIGFVVAAVGFLAIGPGGRISQADDFLSLLFGIPSQQTASSAGQAGASNPDVADRRKSRHGDQAHRHLASAKVARAHAVPLNRRSMCVRLCDGYVFPVGAYYGNSDRTAHEAVCQSTCPDAATALYIEPSGSDKLDDAIQVGTDHAYSDLPDAFHYTTVLNDACTCHKANPSSKRTLSLLHDFTLRRGDAVMTAGGIRVFHGGEHFPFQKADFMALSKSKDVRKSDRASYSAIEQVSLPALKSGPNG